MWKWVWRDGIDPYFPRSIGDLLYRPQFELNRNFTAYCASSYVYPPFHIYNNVKVNSALKTLKETEHLVKYLCQSPPFYIIVCTCDRFTNPAHAFWDTQLQLQEQSCNCAALWIIVKVLLHPLHTRHILQFSCVHFYLWIDQRQHRVSEARDKMDMCGRQDEGERGEKCQSNGPVNAGSRWHSP